MLFNSFNFCILVIATFGLYYALPAKWFQIPVLIAASFIFYAAHHAELLLLLVASVAINILTSFGVVYGIARWRRIYALLGVASNLGILAFFKYAGLFGRTFLPAGNDFGEWLTTIPLPIGISFFTFQGISLMIDTFRGERDGTRSFFVNPSFLRHARNTALFISFFPQLVAGPIVKANEFLPQIGTKRFIEIDWEFCVKALILGYFLKMVIADNLKDQTFWLQYPYFEYYSTTTLVVILFGYSMQIFADFAGYSLIAIGVGGLVGYRLPTNFDFPYISSSFAEFWKRWHMSLSRFLRDYLYYPLGGNRKGRVRTYINLMTVMALGGLWHGAAWSYAAWGIYHGILLAGERMLRNIFPFSSRKPLFVAMRACFVFTAVSFGWLLFKLTEFSHVVIFLRALAGNTGMGIKPGVTAFTLLFGAPVVVYHAFHVISGRLSAQAVSRFEPVLYAIMLFLIATNSGSPNEFIYFQF